MEEKMKRTMFVALALLLGLALWIIKVGWAQKSNTDNVGQRQQKNRFEINDWGTLKVVRDEDGREIFGPGRPPNEGYSIAYRRLDPRTRKPMEAPRAFFAVGAHYSESQLELEECDKECKNKLHRDQAVAAVNTRDGVLCITSNFYFLEREGKLKIVRLIRNISKNPVQLVSIREQYDTRLNSETETQFGKVKPPKISQAQPKFTSPNAFVSGSWMTAAPIFHPYCDPCPPYCDVTLTLSAGGKEVICVECPKAGSSILEYMAKKVPPGQDPQTLIRNWMDKGGECEHSIIVDVWNGQVKFSVDDKRPGELRIGELICVNCPKTAEATFIVQAVLEDATYTPGQCQLAIHVDKGAYESANPKTGKTTANVNDGQIGPNEQMATVQFFNVQK
jgi:hypothetical protein